MCINGIYVIHTEYSLLLLLYVLSKQGKKKYNYLGVFVGFVQAPAAAADHDGVKVGAGGQGKKKYNANNNVSFFSFHLRVISFSGHFISLYKKYPLEKNKRERKLQLC